MNELQKLLINEMRKQFGGDFYVPEFKSEEEARQFIQKNVDEFTWYCPCSEEFNKFVEEEITAELGIEYLTDIIDFLPSDGEYDFAYDDFDDYPSEYEDTYSPGDDFETDWIRGLE